MSLFYPFQLRTCAAGLLLLGLSVDVRADILSDWNSSLLGAAADSNQYSPEVARSMAMMHTAIYNTFESISGNYELYTHGTYTGPSATPIAGSYLDAAISAAAFTMANHLYGSASAFSDLFSAQVSVLPDDENRLNAIQFGTIVANDIFNWRDGGSDNDGSQDAALPYHYTPVGSAGYWAETSGPAVLPGWGQVATFAITGTSTYQNTLGSSNSAYMATTEYADDFNQVKGLGDSTNPGNVRTGAQTDSAFFWEGAAGSTTNVGLWNGVAEKIITSQGLTLEQAIRLYAALNAGLADASIVMAANKYDTDFWSPETAIQNAGADGNASTVADPTWTPLISSPDMPSYYAEQAILAATAGGILDNFVNPNTVGFTLGSDTDGDGIDDYTFTFGSINEAITQASLSAIYGGTNFEKAVTDGAAAGAQIANDVMSSQFSAVPEPGSAMLLLAAGLACLGRRRRC